MAEKHSKDPSSEISDDMVDRLTGQVLDSTLDGDSRLEAFDALTTGCGVGEGVPDEVFTSVLEILWEYLGVWHIDFDSEGQMLMTLFRNWKERFTPKQIGFVLGIPSCVGRGSFAVFFACLNGEAGQRWERLIAEAKCRTSSRSSRNMRLSGTLNTSPKQGRNCHLHSDGLNSLLPSHSMQHPSGSTWAWTSGCWQYSASK